MIYVTDTLGVSFMQGLVEGNAVRIGKTFNDVQKVLESLEKYKLNISNKAILGTFNKLGINLENAEENEGSKIYPKPGDIVYIIHLKGITKNIYEYKDADELPDTVLITLDQILFEE